MKCCKSLFEIINPPALRIEAFAEAPQRKRERGVKARPLFGGNAQIKKSQTLLLGI